MLKAKKVKRIFMNVPICDQCGAQLKSTGVCLTTYPAQYEYKCPNCDWTETFWENNVPYSLKYEFEEEE